MKNFNELSKSMFATLLFIFSTPTLMAQTLQTVAHVDLEKYAGKWYEIASIPQKFQKDCFCTSAMYTLTDKNYLIVVNRCNRGSKNGKESFIKGKAFVEKNSGNAKLKVQFFWPIKGNYWIIDLAEDYSYAVVGHPDRNYLWILSRTPTMSELTYEQIYLRIQDKGYDGLKIVKTQQY